ncbi:hypothetical protein BDZ45DRAFT_686261 [Acephala macrosclerotiorum]|nr:hypothetical protein BDZ45DRAFT_686261 [Acephala macrosclerotiorum]
MDTSLEPSTTTNNEPLQGPNTLEIFTKELPDAERELYIHHADEERTYLEMLTEALPDFGRELFFHHEKFDLFPELPVEIRLQIWRFAFPRPRHVSLDTGFGALPDEFIRWYNSWGPQLPITLRINRESRVETLRRYTILYMRDFMRWGPIEYHDFPERPFCFDPVRDSLRLRYCWDRAGYMNRWLRYLHSMLPEGSKSIRALEIVNFCPEGELEPTFQQFHIWREESNQRTGLEWFDNLHKLQLSICGCAAYDGAKLKSFGQVIKDWYIKYQEREPGCRISEIIVDRLEEERPNDDSIM